MGNLQPNLNCFFRQKEEDQSKMNLRKIKENKKAIEDNEKAIIENRTEITRLGDRIDNKFNITNGKIQRVEDLLCCKLDLIMVGINKK